LEAGGYTVLPVQLASEALQALDTRIAELSGLVTDIRLPGGLTVGTLPGTRAN